MLLVRARAAPIVCTGFTWRKLTHATAKLICRRYSACNSMTEHEQLSHEASGQWSRKAMHAMPPLQALDAGHPMQDVLQCATNHDMMII